MILLSTLNATYQHCAFGLRYLKANLAELAEQTEIIEFTIAQKPRDIALSLLEKKPQIVGLGVYVWNASATFEVVSILKQVSPETLVVLGGPEVSYEQEQQPLCALADAVISGEGEVAFLQICRDFLNDGRLPQARFLPAVLPDAGALRLPYKLYSDEDIRNRILYVEASRGCPYRCEFCLSSLDTQVRKFELDGFLAEMGHLIARGAKQLKFVDRTFNLHLATSTRILQFLLPYCQRGLFVHFEMIPDRLPSELIALLAEFPEGSCQLEIGVQTWNPEVGTLISRRQDYTKVQENFRRLRQETKVHLHADLIVGLPGESLASFRRGFDELAALRPHEIQVGILKRLRGTPIARHDREWAMKYETVPPYTVLQTRDLPFDQVQFMVKFAKFWDLFANSGNFPSLLHFFRQSESLFDAFSEFVTFLDQRHPQRYAIALVNQVESAFLFLRHVRGIGFAQAREILLHDYCGRANRDIPRFLREEGEAATNSQRSQVAHRAARQARHLPL